MLHLQCRVRLSFPELGRRCDRRAHASLLLPHYFTPLFLANDLRSGIIGWGARFMQGVQEETVPRQRLVVGMR